jgi:anti-sigma-K factor RskA
MNYNTPRLIEELAAQYALGTLRGLARRRFERVYRDNRTALTAVRAWEDRLLDLTTQIAPVRPSPDTWAGIQRRLGHHREHTAPRAGWWSNRMQWAVAAGVAMMAVAIAWFAWLAPSPTLVATIANEQQAQLWRIEGVGEKLIVAASAALARDERHAYELWALPTQAGGAPVSLGLMPQEGERQLRLNPAQRLALAGAKQVAISLEPPGGSPTGAPTGPVLFVATVVGTS